MVWADLRRRQRRAVLQPGDLGLCGAAVETPGVLQQHLLQRTGEFTCGETMGGTPERLSVCLQIKC